MSKYRQTEFEMEDSERVYPKPRVQSLYDPLLVVCSLQSSSRTITETVTSRGTQVQRNPDLLFIHRARRLMPPVGEDFPSRDTSLRTNGCYGVLLPLLVMKEETTGT